MIYILLAVLMLVLDYLYLKVIDSQKKYVWYFACFSMWFILAFRGYYVGGDTVQYIHAFNKSVHTPWSEISTVFEKDTGFYYFTKFLSSIWSNKTWFLAVTAFVSGIGVWIYIRKNTQRPVLALFFFITLANFDFMISGIRQSIAMSLCLLALPFAEKKKPIPFAFLVFIALMVHRSATIFLITYFVVRRKATAINMIVNAIVISTTAFFYEDVLGFANDLLDYDYGVESVGNGLIFYILLLAVLFVAYFSREAWLKSEKDTININMGIITTGMWTVRLFSRTIERPLMYWLNSIPVVLTNAIEGFKGKKEYDYVRYIAIILALGLFAKRHLGMSYYFSFLPGFRF